MRNQLNMHTLSNAIGLNVSWPSQILGIADSIKEADPSFDIERFIKRATRIWEDNYNPELPEDIHY
jgi:hypothetical protein